MILDCALSYHKIFVFCVIFYVCVMYVLELTESVL